MSDAALQSSTEDFDPASPGGINEGLETGDVDAANFGADGHGDIAEAPSGSLEGTQPGRPAVLQIQIAKADEFLEACMTSRPRVTYGLGAKVTAGKSPGHGLTAIDCSGFVREVIRRSTALGNRFPDGSVVQHDWVRTQGYAASTIDDGKDAGGTAVRIAFLSPGDSPSRIGHVVLIHKGRTLESHGGVGPDSRAWDGRGWQGKAKLYVLDPAPAATS